MAEKKVHVRPDYVACHEDETHIASLINGHWYLYEKKGHKYLGKIREDGVYPGKHRPLTTVEPSKPEPVILNVLDIAACEYGFSKAILDLCTESWKEQAGSRWKDILVEIIVGQSPNSYLKSERNVSGLRVSIGNHRRNLKVQMGISIEEIWNILGNVYLLRGNEINGITALTDTQKAFCQAHDLNLEVML